jgi:Bacterial PH domain
MSAINQTFQSAPAGKRVILSTVFSVLAFLGMIVADLRVTLPSYGWMPVSKRVAVALTPVLTALVGGFFFLRQRSRVAQFAIADDVLVLGKKKYPLRGATEILRDPAVLKGACRRYGNGGIGAITGKFKSKKYGRFDVFLTGTENAVVIRWPDTAVAVSPLDTEFFILSARKAAGLA